MRRRELLKPRVPLSEIGVARWQHDLWIKVIRADIDGNPHQVGLDWHPSLSLPAGQRYSASSPHLLAWLDEHNAGKAYEDQAALRIPACLYGEVGGTC